MFYIHDTISFRQRQTDLKLTNWKFKSTLFVLTFLIILIPTHHTFADITTGLIGHWAFDENSGITANDSSVNNNVGALINGPTWTKGKIGGALLFDGVNDYVNISNDIFTGSPYTISAWIYISTIEATTVFEASTRPIITMYNSAGFGKIRFKSSAANLDSSALAANTWYHLVFVNNKTTSSIYINGQFDISGTDGQGVGNDFNIGSNSTSQFFPGIIDDVRIYNRVLTQAEIIELYSIGSGTTPLTTCTSFEYTSWSQCLSNSTQTRTIISSSPLGCSGGTPQLTQSCMYIHPPADTTLPTTPTNLSANAISSSQINLSWNASTDNLSVAGYNIYRNSIFLTRTSNTSYTDAGLTQSTSYSYKITAYDSAGNVSPESIQVNATTKAQSQGLKTIHPRLMDQTWINRLKVWSNSSPTWEPYSRFKSFADRNFAGSYIDGSILYAKALMWKMGKGDSYLADSLANYDNIINSVGTASSAISSKAQMIAMAYDLLYDQLPTSSQKNTVDKFIEWQDIIRKSGPINSNLPLWNYSSALWSPAMVAAAAGAGDLSNQLNDLATEYDTWKTDYFTPTLDYANDLLKGDMVEGTFYGTIFDSRYFLQAAEAVFMAEGEDIYSSNEWFGKRLTWEWQTYQTLPKVNDPINGDPGRLYHAWGHSERFRATVPAVSRVNILLLLTRLASHPHQGQVYHSLYKNNDPDLNKMAYDTTYNVVIPAFIYSAKNLESDSTQPYLQFWTTNSNTTYGPGKVFMRSGYSPSDIYISYKAGDLYFRGHENLEEGSFQIYAKGEDLAVHSGTYAGSGELTQSVQYWSSTVSTNSLIIYDPNEKFHFVGRAKDNDGGQRTYTDYPQMTATVAEWESATKMPGGQSNPFGATNHHGSILKAENVNDEYAYVYSDITRAYNSDEYVEGLQKGNTAKVAKVTRELTLLNKKYIIIFDKLLKKYTTNYSATPREGEPYPYQDKWLLHSLADFSVNGAKSLVSDGEQLYTSPNGSFSTTVNNSVMYGQVVYPTTNYQIRRFNGNKRYWNYQRNISINKNLSYPDNNQGNWYNMQWGADRIEIEPTDANLNHYYLVVLYPEYVTGPSIPETVDVNVIGEMKGAHIKDNSTNIVALFGSKISDLNIKTSFSYNVTTTAASKHYIFDLVPNTVYTISVNGVTMAKTSSTSGVILFEKPIVGAMTVSVNSDGSLSPLTADLNKDNTVNTLDWSIMNSKWNTNDSQADLNKDGVVNTLDWSIMNGNWSV